MELSKEQYKNALKADGVLKDDNLELLNFLFYSTLCEATAPQITAALGYGNQPGPANAILGNLGKRIAKQLGIELPERQNNSPGWWQLIAHGEQRTEGFVWRLREELIDALIELDLIDDFAEEMFPETVSGGYEYEEGSVKTVNVNYYERNPVARKLCIDHYGCSCVVCGFDFLEKYGNLGQDFIHVHHLLEISTIGKKYKVSPIKDLRPVCPNCHSMLHKKRPAYSIEELSEIINLRHAMRSS